MRSLALALTLLLLPAAALAQGTWDYRASAPLGRTGVEAGYANGYIFVPGGSNGTADTADHQRFDPVNNVWAPAGTAAPVPATLRHYALAVVNGTATYRYSPATNTWTAMAAMPTGRSREKGSAVGNIVYVHGGYDNLNALATLEGYDTVANTWTALAAMPTARRNQASVNPGDGRVYVAG